MKFLKNIFPTWIPFLKYNMKVVFGGKFIWFILGAVAIFLAVSIVMVLNADTIAEEDIFTTLMMPALILIFYPTVFGLQNDADAKMMEIIFGIPDYRFKIWLVRFLMTGVIVYVHLLLFATFSNFMILPIPIVEMGGEMFYSVILIGSLGFLFSTFFRSGTGSAVAVIVVAFLFMLLQDVVEGTMWDIYMNPYKSYGVNENLWGDILLKNRVMLVAVTTTNLLWSLFNLQKREKLARI